MSLHRVQRFTPRLNLGTKLRATKALSTVSISMGSYSSTPVEGGQSTTLDYYPRTQDDVFAVRLFLLNLLPLELSDIIIDMAQYWPMISSRNDRAFHLAASDSERNNATCCCLVTERIPGRKHHPNEDRITSAKVRMVRFLLKSHDQGWSDNATDHGKYRCSPIQSCD